MAIRKHTNDDQAMLAMGVKCLSLQEFEAVMRRELREYVQRNIASSLRAPSNTEAKNLLGAIKMVMLDTQLDKHNYLTRKPGEAPSSPADFMPRPGSAVPGSNLAVQPGVWGLDGAAAATPVSDVLCEGWVYKRGGAARVCVYVPLSD